jgi:DNA-directed RNA polymerase specialized sigma24 family protein
MTAASSSDAPWPSTVWNLIRDLDKPGHRRMASEILAARYWRPVYAALRKKGYAHHDAADYTQEFFLALFTRDWALRADEKKGRFRAFLSTLLFRFVRDLEERRQGRFERNHHDLQFDAAESDARLLDWQSPPSPQEAFWRQYSRDILDRALAKLRDDAERSDDPLDRVSCNLFLRRVEDQIEDRRPSWEQLAVEFSLPPHRARYAYRKGLERFREHFASELGEEGESAGGVRDAAKELLGMLKRND